MQSLSRQDSMVPEANMADSGPKVSQKMRRLASSYHLFAHGDIDRHVVTDIFREKHDHLVKNFFSRNPELWPIFKNPDCQEVLDFYVNAPKGEMEAEDLPDGVHRRKALLTEPVPSNMVSTDHIANLRSDLAFSAKLSKNWYTPLSNENVINLPSDPSIQGMLMCLLSNPNIVHYEYSKMAADLEDTVAQMMGRQVGFDPDRVSGIFTSGGTMCNLYGYLLGIRKSFRESVHHGIPAGQDYRFIHSLSGHYSNVTALSTLGTDIQSKSISLKTLDDNTVDYDDLERQLDDCFRLNIKVPAILLTIGTTDTFGVDDPKKAYDIRAKMIKKYNLKDDWIPHLHCDSAVGWPMVFFNDYDLEANPIGLNRKTVEVITKHRELFRSLKYADSMTVDFHKWGYCPYSASMVLIKEKKDLMFMSNDPENFSYFNADPQGHTQFHATIECSRPGVGIFGAFASLRALGVEGHQVAIAHGLQNANYLRHKLHSDFHNVITIGDHNGGPSVCWRIYEGMSSHEESQATFETELNMEYDDMVAVTELQEHGIFHRKVHDEIQEMNNVGREAGLSIDWIQHMVRTSFDDCGNCHWIPGQKVVFFNTKTTYADIDIYLANLKRVIEKYELSGKRSSAATGPSKRARVGQ